MPGKASKSSSGTPRSTIESFEHVTVPVGALDVAFYRDDIAALVLTSNAQTGDTVLFSILSQGDQGWRIDDEAVVEPRRRPVVELQAAGEAVGVLVDVQRRTAAGRCRRGGLAWLLEVEVVFAG